MKSVYHLFLFGLMLVLNMPNVTQAQQFQIQSGGNGQVDMTGVYKVNDGGICYIQQTKKRLCFVMEFPGRYSIVAITDGQSNLNLWVNKKEKGFWYATPKYSQKNQGRFEFRIKSPTEIALMNMEAISPAIKSMKKLRVNAGLISQYPRTKKKATFKGNSKINLDGLWTAGQSYRHYVYHDLHGDLIWFGESDFTKGKRPNYANIFIGKYNRFSQEISGIMVPIPKSKNSGATEIPLKIKVNHKGKWTKESGLLFLTNWTRRTWVEEDNRTPTTGQQIKDQDKRNLNRIYKTRDGSGIAYFHHTNQNKFRGAVESPVKRYARVIDGTVIGDMINISWWDVPKYGANGQGTIRLRILENGKRLMLESQTGSPFLINQFVAANVTPHLIRQLPKIEDTAYEDGDKNTKVTGVWIGDDGMRYYVRHIGGGDTGPSRVVWFAERPFARGNRPQDAHVFVGSMQSEASPLVYHGRQSDGASIQGLRITGEMTSIPKQNEWRPTYGASHVVVMKSLSNFARERMYKMAGNQMQSYEWTRNCCLQNIGSVPKPAANKSASVVLYYYGDGFFFSLIQNTVVDLELATKGYDRSVVLQEKYRNVGQDVHDAPTEERLLFHLKKLAAEGYYIDLYLFTHGSKTGISTKDPGALTPNELRRELCHIYGKGRFPIRMVYMGLCWGSEMNEAFTDIGAKVSAGSRYVNFLPFRINDFMRAWNNNLTFGNAIQESYNEKDIDGSAAVRAGLNAQYKGFAANNHNKPGWNCDIGGESLRESKHCIRMFLEQKYHMEPHYWRPGGSGWTQIGYASHMLIDGDANVKKSYQLNW